MSAASAKKILQALALGGAGGAGYYAGKKIQKSKSNETVAKARQSSELNKKLREGSESKNRRLKIENYYVRQALNQLASKYRQKKK